MTSSPLVEVKNVKKYYGTKAALDDVSLTLYPGEILTLLGPNGAGKTTLSSLIASLHPVSAGDILFKGASIYEDIISYRWHLGFCPQKPNLSTSLTVREHLIFSGRYHLMKTADINERAQSLMEKYALTQYANESPEKLSGGYKQRLSLARALIHRPSLVILDEPTVALDPHIRRQLWDMIKELKATGTSVLLTTHYLEEAEMLSDRICVLDKGKIRLVDTPQALMTSYNKTNLEDVFIQIIQENQE